MARATVSRPYRGTSADDRRSERRERLLEAGLDLFGRDGHAQTTVREVCGHAGLSPRYFYESFDDLEALLVAVFDRVVAEASEAVLAAIGAAPDDAYSKAHAAIDGFVQFMTGDPRRARVAFVEAVGSEPLVRRRSVAMDLFSRLVAGQGSEFYGLGDDADPLVDVTASLLVGGMAELMIRWLRGSLELSREQLVTDITELVVATGESAAVIARRRARSRA